MGSRRTRRPIAGLDPIERYRVRRSFAAVVGVDKSTHWLELNTKLSARSRAESPAPGLSSWRTRSPGCTGGSGARCSCTAAERGASYSPAPDHERRQRHACHLLRPSSGQSAHVRLGSGFTQEHDSLCARQRSRGAGPCGCWRGCGSRTWRSCSGTAAGTGCSAS